MKEMMKTYLILAAGTPVLLTASCFLFRDVSVAGALVYAIPVLLLAFFMWRLFSTEVRHKTLHIAGGFLVMIASWFVSVLIIGAIAISQTGLEGTQ